MSSLGKRWKLSDETKLKMRLAALGKPKSDATRAAMSAAKKGKPGHKHSAASRAKLSVAHKGKKLSAEHRAKLSAAKLGKPGPWLGKKRPPLSPEHKKALTTSRLGIPPDFPKQRFYYRDVPFRSSWERSVAIELDRRGIKWEFEKHRFALPDGKSYLPDFFLPEVDCFWEVKGWLGPKAQRVINTFRSESIQKCRWS